MTCITITSIPWYVYAITVLFIGIQGKGNSRIFLWRFLSSLHSKAAIGSFYLGACFPRKILKLGYHRLHPMPSGAVFFHFLFKPENNVSLELTDDSANALNLTNNYLWLASTAIITPNLNFCQASWSVPGIFPCWRLYCQSSWLVGWSDSLS